MWWCLLLERNARKLARCVLMGGKFLNQPIQIEGHVFKSHYSEKLLKVDYSNLLLYLLFANKFFFNGKFFFFCFSLAFFNKS